MSEQTPTILSRVKTALRVTTTAFDDEITMLIESACADLNLAGVSYEVLNDVNENPSIMQAVICYCKSRFGDPETGAKWEELYKMQKAQLKCHKEYKA